MRSELLEDRHLLAADIVNVDTFAMAANDTLEIEIGGLTPGPGATENDGHDQLNIANTATLAGTIKVTLLDGFQPQVGDTFDVVTFGSVSGQFADAEGLFRVDSPTQFFDVVQTSDKIQLVVTESPGLDLLPISNDALDLAAQFFSTDYFSVETPFTLDGEFELPNELQVGGIKTATGSVEVQETGVVGTLSIPGSPVAPVSYTHLTLPTKA